MPEISDVERMHHCIALAEESPQKETNYRVGALLVSTRGGAYGSEARIEATGYTLELPGNTHAEQCCLRKLAANYGVAEDAVGGLDVMLKENGTPGMVLYTTMEPCSERLSGQQSCVDRILATRSPGRGTAVNGIQQVYVGVTEPTTFVKENSGRVKLEKAGVEVHHVPGLESIILEVATAGHKKKAENGEG